MKSRIVLLTILVLTACGKITTPPPPVTPTEVIISATPTDVLVSPTATAQPRTETCQPTMDDGLSPSYVPDTPVRSVVGSGHVLSGVVRSSRDCAPIAKAQLELWPEIAGKGHPDESRATLFTDSEGRYRFECDMPEHIHMRISAPGFRTLAQNSYHPNGAAEGTFDIVLEPESP
jgi:protocatechuate 3,4-dioxygenase beta subunit